MIGTATLYMGNPMTSLELPIEGTCSVDGKTLSLKFPGTGTSIPLPQEPRAGQADFQFQLQGGLEFSVGYNYKLKCFRGEGRIEDSGKRVVSFVFYNDDNELADLYK